MSASGTRGPSRPLRSLILKNQNGIVNASNGSTTKSAAGTACVPSMVRTNLAVLVYLGCIAIF